MHNVGALDMEIGVAMQCVCFTTKRVPRILKNSTLGYDEQWDRDSKHHQEQSCKLEHSAGIQPFVRHAWQPWQLFKLAKQGLQLLWGQGAKYALVNVYDAASEAVVLKQK